MKSKLLYFGAAVFSLLLMAAPGARSQGLTFTTNTYAVGSQPDAVAVADINGDGNPDLISANYGGNSLTVLNNNGSGLFGVNATLPVGTNPVFVAAADINGDGHPDLICANAGENSLTVFTNNGNGGFGFNATLEDFYGVGTPDGLVLTNIFGNSYPDLICANTNGLLVVFQNTGPGEFVFQNTYGVGSGSEYVIAADVNGDGHPDLITADYANNTLTVLTNDGTGNFPNLTTYTVGTNPVCVAAADINGDGKVDLVCANYTSKSLTVLTNNGHGVFGSNATINLSGKPTSLALQDLNNDGKPDLVVTVSALVSDIQVFTNNGSGGFGSNTTINLGTQSSVVTANVTGTTRKYVITANHSPLGKLTVLTQPGPFSPHLTITHPSLNSFKVSWVSTYTNFILQTNSNLTAPNWSPANLPLSLSNGTNQSSTLNPAPPGKLFFRLVE